MDDILGVQVFQPQKYTCYEEARLVLVEPLALADMVPQVAAGHVLHY